MLSYKIEKDNKKREVSEFAWKNRYQQQGWKIVDQWGKPMEEAMSAPLPPQAAFQPPEALQKLKKSVAADAERNDEFDPAGDGVGLTDNLDESLATVGLKLNPNAEFLLPPQEKIKIEDKPAERVKRPYNKKAK